MKKPLLKPNAKAIDLTEQLAMTIFLQILKQKQANPDNQEILEFQEKLKGQARWVRNVQDSLILTCQLVIDENDKCSECVDGITKLGMTKVCGKCEGSGIWLR